MIMIGVTIGVGAYRSLAAQAAESMRRHTGLNCVVLSDEHYESAGLSGCPPHFLKLAIWDFIDADQVLWFDADSICLRDWNPQDLVDGRAVVAVRDWIWRDGIQREAAQIRLPLEEYFLASVMLLNRHHHEPMMRLAREIHQEIDSQVFEQTALNRARAQLNIPIRFLDRRYNWSLFGKGNFHECSDCIVAHFNEPQLRANVLEVLKCASKAAGTIEEDQFAKLGGRFYRYVRIGYDERPLQLRKDGTIGDGGGTAERFWFVRKSGNGPILVIGSETNVTCELTLGAEGEWRGNWLQHERMPILLAPHHGQVVVDLLSDSQHAWQGAEVGVFRGHCSALLLRSLPNLRLTMVDTWHSPIPGEALWNDPHLRQINVKDMADALELTLRTTEFAKERRKIIVADLASAADSVSDCSLDFVFLDADHSLEGTLQAIEKWLPKVKTGGVVAGHDLDYPDYPSVRRAVEVYCARHHLEWHVAPDYVWWFQVPAESGERHHDSINASSPETLGVASIHRNRSNLSAESDVDFAAFHLMGGRYYRYVRVGYDERPLHFGCDGTIGAGAGEAERYWCVRNTAQGKVLSINSERSVTCELMQSPDESWRGIWRHHEQMPIELSLHRGQVLLDLLKDPTRALRGAEVGVFEGHTSALLLRALPQLSLLMVDAWTSPIESDRLWQDPYMKRVSQSQMLIALTSCMSRTDFAAERRRIIVCDLVSAAVGIPDNSLDFVFLDADHSEAGTQEAIQAWAPKVMPGGIVAGHDLDHPDFPGVRIAVEKYTSESHLKWYAESDFVWWFRSLLNK